MTSPAPTAPPPGMRYSRVLLKLSGEALMGDGTYGIDPNVATRIASEVADIQSLSLIHI